jgi:glycosyltransferase XagB
MQTYIVHMRAPAKLARDLGGRRFAGFQVLMGGLILSALVHPWFYILLMLDASDGSIFDRGEQAVTQGIWWICAANLAAGYVSAILVGMVAVVQSGQRWLAPYALLMPIYWIAISCAAYLAVLELVSAPFYWEKTEHTGAGRDPDVLSVTDIRT